VTDLFRRVAPTLLFTHPRHDTCLIIETYIRWPERLRLVIRFLMRPSCPLVDGSGDSMLYYCDPIEARDPYTGELVEPNDLCDIK